VRVLCTGDIHIGRRASRLPEPLPGELDARQFSAAASWSALVDLAISEQVDVVAISGDVIDRQNRYFEAAGPFERGIRRLAEAGIEAVAVTGNHDFDVLPLLARGLPVGQLRLLGVGGVWERHTIERDGAPALHIDGWSFPSEHVLSNPLDSYLSSPGDGVPVLGLLHADLDQSASRYAPVALHDLTQTPVTAWLLGHIHHPQAIAADGRPLILYPGSPLAMDPGETGPHGPWLMELAPGQPARCRQLPASPIRYDQLSVALDAVSGRDDLLDQINAAVQRRLLEISDAGGDLTYVAFRLVLTGRTPLHRELARHLRELQADFHPQQNGVTGFVERLLDETRPAIDLNDLSRRNDPPGELARVLQALEADPAPVSYRPLLDDTLARLNDLRRQRVYSGIASDDLATLADARRYLLDEGYRLLDTLIAQREQVGA
jgi:DNA repair exonuclease SbcCD nuclease subunit